MDESATEMKSKRFAVATFAVAFLFATENAATLNQQHKYLKDDDLPTTGRL